MKSEEDLKRAGSRPVTPAFREVLAVWIRIGLLSFGGPAGQIALMHRELVERRRWLGERRFLHALNYCMLLPGPEAQQLAIHTGWLLHGTRGGIAAGTLFVLPGALLMWCISCIYVYQGDLQWVEWVFYGLKAAVMAIVVMAMLRIGKKVLHHPLLWVVAVTALLALLVFKLPFPLIVIAALVAGLVFGKRLPGTGKQGLPENEIAAGRGVSPSWKSTLGQCVLWLAVWLAPLAACLAVLGKTHALTVGSAFFSKAALLTFGGAYAVLPYVAQQAVETQVWLTPGQMIDGLGLAETTPGPLVLVLQFVGFLGAWNSPGTLPPLAAATIGAFLTTWATFVPGFLFIFAGAPWIERTLGNPRLSGALTVVTAAVVGVIANLAIWFGWNVVVPAPGKTDLLPLAMAAAFFLLLRSGKCGVITIVSLGALAGLAAVWLGAA
ncbi:MAG TPA: chromate efflux transporter [Luteolibacter sp.]|nr:chromate efflux transporter [Luteolibacter sp.]